MSTAAPLQQIKEGMRATWMAGDFGLVARTINSGAETFVDRLSYSPGTQVLDVACGTGNVAIPLARRGAVVTGVDIAANLLEQARARATAEGLSVRFDEGDAEQLPYPDASFQAVVSMFGAMFAPRPELVASELARVVRPGGRLAMANWTPGSFSGKMFQATARHVSPPVLWGDETTVRQRLSPYFHDLQTQLISIDFDMAASPAGAVDFFRKYFGPTHVAFSRLDEAGQLALAADLVSLWTAANTAPDPANRTLIHNQYLQVTATRN